jgi:glycine/D-amino acid oxidase-like deaminating enzyme
MYDVIVVGARCAGSPTAMLLARKGYRVLLVDKARFPSNTVLSTHCVWQAGIALLDRWGLLDQVRASNCPPKHLGTPGFRISGGGGHAGAGREHRRGFLSAAHRARQDPGGRRGRRRR